MKKKNLKKALAALCLALALFAPTAFAACADGASSITPPQAELPNENSNGAALPEQPEEIPPETDLPPAADNGNGSNSESNGSVVTPAPEQPQTPPATPVQKKAEYIRCVGNNVNVRTGAGTNFSVLGQAEAGTMYAVIGKSGNWYKTYYKNQVAYLYAEYASVFTLQKADSKTENVIEEGYKLIGTPYVYGAVRLHDGKGNLLKNFSVKKFDCSSLIQYIFYKGAGKLLDVTTRTQVKQGQYVKRADLQRGDCIYFTNAERENKTGVERIGHVAIYLGDNYILHTASDYARIEKMSAKRWSYYVEARRFL